MIIQQDRDYFINLKTEEITRNLLSALFADRYNKEKKQVVKSKYNPTDKIRLKKGECYATKDMDTTIGRLIFNKAVLFPSFGGILGYVDIVISKDSLGALEEEISGYILEDKITTEQFLTYLTRIQWLGSVINHIVTPSFTMNTFKPNKDVIAKRTQLTKKYEKDLEDGNVIRCVEIENELIDLAKDKMKGDPSMDLFDSGARGSFGNNYKNFCIMKGTTYSPVEGKFVLMDNNLVEGIDKKYMHLQGNAIIEGNYAKGVGTADAGYLLKQLVATFQTVVLDEHGTDCGSKGTVRIKITKRNHDRLLYRYIVEGKKLVLLTPDSIGKYMNKTVEMRGPMYCLGEKLCNKCAGEIFYKLGIENVGLITAQISSDILNMGMKKFHDASQKTVELDLDKIFL